MLPLFMPAKYMAIEYAKKDASAAFIIVRSLQQVIIETIRICPRSIRSDTKYRVTLSIEGTSYCMNGRELRETGVSLHGFTTEIVLLVEMRDECTPNDARQHKG